MKTLLALFLIMNMHSAFACGYAQNECKSNDDCCDNCSCNIPQGETTGKCGGNNCPEG
jgi:hypothetical protein